MMRKIERENTGLLQAGQDLVVAGYAGLAGTVKLAEAARKSCPAGFPMNIWKKLQTLRRFAR